jgi:hypothetical protein
VVGVAAGGVERLEQATAVFQVVEVVAQGHVVAGAAGHVERGVRAAEPGRPVGQNLAEADVGRQTGMAGRAAELR